MSTEDQQATYGADSIQRLEGLEAVRKRPGMYIGTPDAKGAVHLAIEIIDNSVDEALAGHCTEVSVFIAEDSTITVSDDGRGIPTDNHRQTGEPAFLMVFEDLHAGGKFDAGAYKVSAGLHGVGASVTNALSEHLEVEIHNSGHIWTAGWREGRRASGPTRGAATKKTGTKVTWRHDETIFKNVHSVSPQAIERLLTHRAYLLRGLRFRFQVEGQEERVIESKGGLREFVEIHAEAHQPVHPKALHFEEDKFEVEVDGEQRDVAIEVALQWTDSDPNELHSFANIVFNRDGGTHTSGMQSAITRVLHNYAYETKALSKDKKEPDRFDSRDIFSSLVAAISVKLPEAQFKNQTKDALLNPEARTAVMKFLYERLTEWFADPRNAKIAKTILERCLFARRQRLNQGKAKKFSQSWITASNDFGKLSDCDAGTPADQRELFVVEGDSAGGSAKSGRDRRTQAILPLRGKPQNVMNVPGKSTSERSAKIFDNAEIAAITNVLGGRIEEFEGRMSALLDVAEMRYQKVIITADADDDGAHITSLLICAFWELFPQVVRSGRLFVAIPPLFRIRLDGRGEKYVWAYSNKERSDLIAKHKRKGEDSQRFKGLGEMNPEQLAETVMSPATRRLAQVEVGDAAALAETLKLMFGKAVEPRKTWLDDGSFAAALEASEAEFSA